MSDPNVNEDHIIPPKKRRWGRRLLWFILLCLLLVVGLILLTQIPVVQDWGSKKLANYLSKKFNSEVQVDGFRLVWTDVIELNNVLIRDLDQDTMIYVGTLEADLNNPIRGMLEGQVKVDGLVLSDAFVNVKFKAGDWYNNLDQVFKGVIHPVDSVIEQINSDSMTALSESGDMYYLDDLELNNIRVRNFHEIKGKEELFYLRKGTFARASFDVNNNVLNTDDMWLDGFEVDITNFDYDLDRYNEVFVDPYSHFTQEPPDPYPLNLTAQKAFVSNGKLKLNNLRKSPVKMTAVDELDWFHLDLYNIEIGADSFYMNEWKFGGVLNTLRAESSSGFNIVDASAGEIRVTEQLATLNEFTIQSSMSSLQGDLKFIYKQYPDFKNFENAVRFDFRSNNSEVGVNDLMTFSPGLKKNPFFFDNYDELISIDGRILGYVNNLKGRSLKLKIGKQFNVTGLIDVRDFTDPDRTRINLDLQELVTDMTTIRELVPKLELPDQFNRLGSLNLTGQFNGLLKDFIASGELKTDIGQARFNMYLNFLNEVTDAKYSGDLELRNFNLGSWTENDAFGIVNLKSSISEGRGLTSASARGKLSTSIETFEYKNYTYTNAEFSGILQNELINGSFTIADEHVDLSWEGRIEVGEKPRIDVSGVLAHSDFKSLNLLNDDLYVSTAFDIDIQDINPDRFTGEILLQEIFIGNVADSLEAIDSISIVSAFRADSTKEFLIESDVLSGRVEGQFRILSLPNYFINYLTTFNPTIAQKLNLNEKENLPYGVFDIVFDVHNSGGLLSYATDRIDTLRDVHVEGWFDSGSGYFLQGYTPALTYDNAIFQDLNLFATGEDAYSNIVVSHDGLKLGRISLSPLTIFADLERDTLLYVFNEVAFQSYIDQINIEGKLYVNDGFWQTQVYDSELQMFGEDWTINNNNFLQFQPQKLLVRNLNLSHDNEYIKIKSINDDRGLSVELQDLPLERINGFINYDKLKFAGNLSGAVRTMSLKNLDGIAANLISPKVLINGDDFGEFTLTARSEGPEKPVFVDLNLIKDEQRLLGLAQVNLPNRKERFKGDINAQLTIEQYPARIIEYFVVNGLSNTTGYFHGSITATGPLNDPRIEGDISIPSSSFQIDILGTTYYLENQLVHINSNLIDASGVVVKDRFNNQAVVEGGLTHHNLGKLGFDARLRSDEILILETTKEDGEIYYGTCFADVRAEFLGTVQLPIINVEAENKPNSIFTINNDLGEQSGGLDFIVFDFDTIQVASENDKPILGVDLTIDMTVNPGVQVQIILDESTRDIIQGTGSGDLIFKYSPAGEMSLFGDYTIDQGDYLFTYSVGGLVPVNKPFKIRKGSKLQWTDDPFEADVDIQADYTVIAAPYNLIAGERSDFVLEDARQKTDVVLELLLRGPMFQPEINFNIELPEVTGQLKNAVDVELARIENDQTEVQNQAASLIIFGDFARSEYTAGTSVGAVANTISEWLSNQVSYYLTGLVSAIVSDVGFIDDIQFDVGYRLPTGEYTTVGGSSPGITGSEVGVSTRVIMFDRRLEASIKGDYINTTTGGTETPSNYFNADIQVDYMLTKDRRWRLRAYTRQDQFYNDRRTRSGLGLTWRREYDDLEQYKQAIKALSEERKDNVEGSSR